MFHSRPRVCVEANLAEIEDISDMFKHWGCPKDRWRISSCNTELKASQLTVCVRKLSASFPQQLCPSYPGMVIVPAQVTDEDIKKVAGYRYLGRFPVVCYYHSGNKVYALGRGVVVTAHVTPSSSFRQCWCDVDSHYVDLIRNAAGRMCRC